MNEFVNVEYEASAKDLALMAAVRVAVGAFIAHPQPDDVPAPAET